MRLTNRLYAQHIGWYFKQHWQVQGKRLPRDTGAAAELEKFGIVVKDAKDVLVERTERKSICIVGCQPPKILEDATHPNWKERVCHVYSDNNLLLEGIPQAQLLTKTVEINGFPRNIEEAIKRSQLPSTVDRSVQNSIMSSHVFDAEQVKLPKVKLTDRPAFNLPRDYGISYDRRNRLLINKLIFECEKIAGRSATSRRRLIDNANFGVSLTKDDDLLRFTVGVEKMLTSTRPLEPVKGNYDGELPDLYPIKYTISIPKNHIYTTDTIMPFSSGLNCSNPHTIFLHFNKEHVGNLHESGVSNTQFQSRNMIKAFAVAAARAKQIYGDSSLTSLPKPIVVQSIQTDGRSFHFGVFQLNTLNLNGTEGKKNYWFHQPNLDLFTECGYKVGRPILEGYNKDVFRIISAFYANS